MPWNNTTICWAHCSSVPSSATLAHKQFNWRLCVQRHTFSCIDKYKANKRWGRKLFIDGCSIACIESTTASWRQRMGPGHKYTAANKAGWGLFIITICQHVIRWWEEILMSYLSLAEERQYQRKLAAVIIWEYPDILPTLFQLVLGRNFS